MQAYDYLVVRRRKVFETFHTLPDWRRERRSRRDCALFGDLLSASPKEVVEEEADGAGRNIAVDHVCVITRVSCLAYTCHVVRLFTSCILLSPTRHRLTHVRLQIAGCAHP